VLFTQLLVSYQSNEVFNRCSLESAFLYKQVQGRLVLEEGFSRKRQVYFRDVELKEVHLKLLKVLVQPIFLEEALPVFLSNKHSRDAVLV